MGTSPDPQQGLRAHVVDTLRARGAHVAFERAVADLPEHLRGSRPPGIPHTPWRLLEHMRIAQWDILEYCRNPAHVSPEFPDGYWPEGDGPLEPGAWDASVRAFQEDLRAMADLVSDPRSDLLAPLPHCDGATILGEALLAADHNAYHVGQLVIVRRALGAWPGD